MEFALIPEQLQLRDGLRRYLREQYSFEQRTPRLQPGAALDRATWQQFAELGLLAAGLPEDAGGWGGSAVETSLIAEELGRSLVVEPYIENAILAARLLLNCRRDEHLAALASGEQIFAVALHEDARDFGCAHCDTIASPVANGFRLSGRKIMVGWGGAANRLLVLSSISGSDQNDLGLFSVDPQLSGISVSSYSTIDGRQAADISFADVEVPASTLLLSGEAVRPALDDAIDHAIVGLCAESVGCMDAAIELTTSYLGDRKQFGKPLAEFQVLQHRMADMFIEADFARSMTYQALSALGRGPVERGRAVSAAKIRVDHASHFVGGEAVHNHGGMGFTEEYPAGHYFRRLMAIRQSLGDAAYHLDRYSRLGDVA